MEAIDEFPGTQCHLANGYSIVYLRNRRHRARPGTGPLNTSLRRLFCLDWPGNIVVIKRGQSDRDRAVNITMPEVSLINVIVERLVP